MGNHRKVQTFPFRSSYSATDVLPPPRKGGGSPPKRMCTIPGLRRNPRVVPRDARSLDEISFLFIPPKEEYGDPRGSPPVRGGGEGQESLAGLNWGS